MRYIPEIVAVITRPASTAALRRQRRLPLGLDAATASPSAGLDPQLESRDAAAVDDDDDDDDDWGGGGDAAPASDAAASFEHPKCLRSAQGGWEHDVVPPNK